MTGLIVWPWHVCKFPSQTPLFGCEFWDLLCPKKVGSLLLRACPLPRASLIDLSRLEMHLNHFSGRWSANQQIEESLPNVFFSNFPSNWNKSARTIIAWITLEKWPRLLLHPYSCRLGRAGGHGLRQVRYNFSSLEKSWNLESWKNISWKVAGDLRL